MSRPSENDRRQQMVKSSRTLWGSRVQKTFCVPHFLSIRNRHNSASIIGGAMLNKSLIKFSVDGRGCVPSLLLDLRPNSGGGNEDNGDLLQKVPCTATLRAPNLQQATADPPLETPGHSRASLCQSLVGSLLSFPGSWCTQGFVCALQEFVSPVLCKFWRLYGGVNGDLLQEGLCHSQICCT